MTRCPRCGGAVLSLSRDDPRCVACGFRWDDLAVHFPTPEELAAKRGIPHAPFATLTKHDKIMLAEVERWYWTPPAESE